MEMKDKLFELRKAGGYSQEDVANQLNVSRQTVSKWESGQSVPETEKLPAIANLFHVSIDYLLKPSEVDALSVKTMQLENQQKTIMEHQTRVTNRQFLIMSIVLALIVVAVVYFVGRYIMFPDVGEGYTYLGKTVLYGGTLLTVAITVYLNWRHRQKNTKSDT